jgi:hypothetical protein
MVSYVSGLIVSPQLLSTKIYCEAEYSIVIGWLFVSGSNVPTISQWKVLESLSHWSIISSGPSFRQVCLLMLAYAH